MWHNSEGKNRGTTVELYSGDTLLSGASNRLHKDEVFSKPKGRKIALSKVLKLAEVPREERIEVWKSYFEKCKS